ncbi:MBL fold metallo-hydrolase [Aeromicrobium camelliae]|uniref:MBL fold metallo-hydrolase n=1 Tax=Aeromicrobium camelliae TaxID=1538144 RepID=A0A3N6X192_9ACTN|nr:MBL fold metallo-hydrolase [Aeromicrobium camelliae]RQN07518.1 MBL fold metallo-hydrolase [Aeromicrobium camelliae]
MLLTSFPAGPLQANCYFVAAGEGAPCAIVDPGMESFEAIQKVVDQHGFTVAAVLVTHGHFDHMWCAQDVAAAYDCPVWIHPADRHLLSDPMAAISGQSAAMLREQFAGIDMPEFGEPADVRDAVDGARIEVGELVLTVDHCPGHTPGTVMYRVDYPGPEPVSQVAFSGDFLFFGSIGRTDLTGGDHAQMQQSLRDKVLSLPDDVVVLPGHGQQTSVGREKATNPFLAELSA